MAFIKISYVYDGISGVAHDDLHGIDAQYAEAMTPLLRTHLHKSDKNVDM